MAERTISATDARVHFGELLDSVQQGDVVFVERAGRAQAVVVSIEEWRRHGEQARDPWAGIAEEMDERWASMNAETATDQASADDLERILQLAREDRDARPPV